MRGFSVVIPTLQRAEGLWPLVDQCAAHPEVHEVIVINNSPKPLTFGQPKVRVLDQESNIFVNPAWNLGAKVARGELLAIVNDDVRFADEALSYAAALLRRRRYAMVGPDRSCFTAGTFARPISHRPASEMRLTYGTFMCLRTEDYVPIPPELLIWGGDEWLFWQQRKPNAILVHTPMSTDMSTTSRDPVFQALRAKEQEIAGQLWRQMYGTRWWHRPLRALEGLRMAKIRLVDRYLSGRSRGARRPPVVPRGD